MDKIRVLNLKIPGRHGIYEFEKEKDYLFEVDLEVHKSLRQAGVTDKVKNTIDYNDLILFTIDIFRSKDCNLIETVAESICEGIIKNFPVKKVIVKIRKPHAPIPAEFDTVEVEIIRKV